MIGDCPIRSSDWAVEIGDTTLAINDDHDCHPDILATDPKLYRTEGDPDQQDIYIAESDTYAATQPLAMTRGSADIYPVERVLDGATPTPAPLYVSAYTRNACTDPDGGALCAAYTADSATCTAQTDAAGAACTFAAAKFTAHASTPALAAIGVNTPLFVNGLGPFVVTTAVSAADTEIVCVGNEGVDLFGDHDVTGVKWPVSKVVSDTASIAAETVLGLHGRRYKVASKSAAGGVANGKITLTEVISGGMLVKVCEHCVTAVAADGASVTTAQKVTLAEGEMVLVGGLVSEDFALTVTKGTYSETCTSPDGGGACEALALDGAAATCTGQTDAAGAACVHWISASGTTVATSPGCMRGNCAGVGTAPATLSGLTGTDRRHLFKISSTIGYAGAVVTEAATGATYQYVSQCSNRGSCDTTSGLCQCYKGYSGLTCSTQNMVAM